MAKTPVRTEAAPAPFQGAPYNQAIISGGFVFTAGQAGLDESTGQLVGPGIAEQSEKTFDNLQAILEAAGSSMAKIVKTTVFLVDMNDFAAMNEIYKARIPAPHPARSTVAAAKLPAGALVEIEAIAEA
jgi:2-iminobutanoate/2-iminopropanoate deaminase